MRTWLTALLFPLVLWGCGGDVNEDLKAWMDSVKARPPGAIPPMPEMTPQEEFRYAAGDENVRSPFSAFQLGGGSQAVDLISGCPEDSLPDIDRRKEDLERYTLETLKMVGVIGKGNALEAIVRGSAGTNEGVVYRIRPGNFMGVNHGIVTSISEDRIALEEKIPDGTGCWIKRETYVALGQ